MSVDRKFLLREESEALFDKVARRNLGISGAEFRRRLADGEYDGPPENVRAMRVRMLMPVPSSTSDTGTAPESGDMGDAV